MIKVTRLDGSDVFINENNIQWIESMPDTTITFLSGARLLVKEKIADIIQEIEKRLQGDFQFESPKSKNEMSDNL